MNQFVHSTSYMYENILHYSISKFRIYLNAVRSLKKAHGVNTTMVGVLFVCSASSQ